MEEWPERDRALAQALIDYEATAFCPRCHQLKSIAYDEVSDGAWELSKTVHCYACADMEEQEKDLDEPEPGELRSLKLNKEDIKQARLALKRKG